MPEGTEIDIERLQETIHEPPTDSLLRNIALTTALLAAFGAVASLHAGGTVNEALVLKTEAGRLQAEASDQWTYYRAKGIKASVQGGVAGDMDCGRQGRARRLPGPVDSTLRGGTEGHRACRA